MENNSIANFLDKNIEELTLTLKNKAHICNANVTNMNSTYGSATATLKNIFIYNKVETENFYSIEPLIVSKHLSIDLLNPKRFIKYVNPSINKK